MIRINDIIDEVLSYNKEANIDFIKKAYVFAALHHEGQKRKDGSSYMGHPLEVAWILSRMRLDENTIVAGLLHDVVEDTAVSVEEIKEEFGDEVAFLVDGVTKLSAYRFQSEKEREAENFRKMLIAMAKDIRVVLIKLADRLHNMKTLSALPEEKRQEISKETMEIYVPIAHRLGIYWIKSELEDLAFSHLRPALYSRIKEKMRSFEEKHSEYIENVKQMLTEILKSEGIDGEVQGRFKNVYGVYKKMEKYNIDVEEVHDIFAFRIIVNEEADCYHVLGLIHSKFPPVPGRLKDYIALPKMNNYRSLHTTVIGPEGRRIEIQIRTREMHIEAEEGIAAHWKYKSGKGIDEKDIQKYTWLREIISISKESPSAVQFMTVVKEELFSKEIYVFTPKGDVKELPKGAMPLDFAYAIHTEVGNRCVGAKVNGRLVSLDYKLQTGDVVEILTSKNQKPRRDWLKYVITERARSKIKAFLRKEEREEMIKIGEESLLSEMAKKEIPRTLLENRDFVETILKLGGADSLETLYEKIGRGQVKVGKLLRDFGKKESAKPPEEKVQEKGVIIDGERNIVFHFAKCCNPLPGEEIKGIITKRWGISVHRATCPKIRNVSEDMTVDVKWGRDVDILREAKIKVVSVDRPGLLADVSQAISSHHINITNVKVNTTRDGKAVGIFVIAVKNLSQLRGVINAIEGVKGVLYVERVLS